MAEFINPYDFIPFGSDLDEESRKTREDMYSGEARGGLLSGRLDVSLELRTPLIIPDGAHPRNVQGHNIYRFMRSLRPDGSRNREEPMIPGSSLRGMIRSVYETVTNSCLPFLANDKPMSQRVPLFGALKNRGLLGYDGKKWVLYKTKAELEETVVVPVYEANGAYYAESLERVREWKDNWKTDRGTGDFIRDGNGNCQPRYGIMNCLDRIEEALPELEVSPGKKLLFPAVFEKHVDRTVNIKVGDQCLAQNVKEEICRYLFVKADGSAVENKPADLIDGKKWLQYNVPVKTDQIYHIAYLEKAEPEYEWPASSAKGNKSAERTDDRCAEAYKKLRSALVRDGAERYGRDGRRQNNQTNRDCNFALERALESACLTPEKLVPVYYFAVEHEADGGKEKIVYLSGSAIGRIAQRRKWAEIMAGHTPCQDRLCPACLLFGSKEKGGLRGRVRFADAFLKDPSRADENMEQRTLQILGEPRWTAFEFYLRKPDADATYWNFDFYGKAKTEEKNGKTEPAGTEYFHLEKATPRGRKMYWHRGSAAPDDRRTSKMNQTMEVLKEGTFTFRVYFDRITRTQLQDLVWTITLGENLPDGHYLHKLGHGRPLGYGSVKLTVTGGEVRTLRREEGTDELLYRLKPLEEYVPLLKNGETAQGADTRIDGNLKKNVLKMCDSGGLAAPHKIDYPRLRPYGPIYEWFSQNRKNADTLKTLPEPLDQDHVLIGEVGERRRQGAPSGGRSDRNNRPAGGGGNNRKITTMEELKKKYPIGTKLVGVVDGQRPGRVFFKIQGTNDDASAETRGQGSWTTGAAYDLIVVGHYEKKKGVVSVNVNVIRKQ